MEQKLQIRIKTPITYYGGKQQMLRHILPLIPEHVIYTEAFFGGGAVFFAKEPAKIEFINDRNGEVINFYRVLKYNFDELKKEIDATLHSEFQQKQARVIYLHPRGHSRIKRAWAVYVLSHQSFYSILGNTWKYRKGRAFAAQLWAKKDLFTKLYSLRLEHTSIFCRDALDAIKKADHEDAFHYVDPPYFNADMGHYGGYTYEDFQRLLDLLAVIKGKFMLSSYPGELLDTYIQKYGWKSIEFELPRSAGGGRKVEVLTMNYDINDVEVAI